MSSSRKNFSAGYQIVKEDFNNAVAKLFDKPYNGTKCNTPTFINVLFCALCHIQLIFAVCRNLPAASDDTTIASENSSKSIYQLSSEKNHNSKI